VFWGKFFPFPYKSYLFLERRAKKFLTSGEGYFGIFKSGGVVFSRKSGGRYIFLPWKRCSLQFTVFFVGGWNFQFRNYSLSMNLFVMVLKEKLLHYRSYEAFAPAKVTALTLRVRVTRHLYSNFAWKFLDPAWLIVSVCVFPPRTHSRTVTPNIKKKTRKYHRTVISHCHQAQSSKHSHQTHSLQNIVIKHTVFKT